MFNCAQALDASNLTTSRFTRNMENTTTRSLVILVLFIHAMQQFTHKPKLMIGVAWSLVELA